MSKTATLFLEASDGLTFDFVNAETLAEPAYLTDVTAAPIADAGEDISIRPGQEVTLDGSGSYDDNTETENLLYAWSFVSKPTDSSAFLAEADTASPSFVADVSGEYVVELIVTDEAGHSSSPDAIVVSSYNLAPTADAGDDQLVIVGDTVFLDGSESTDPEHDQLSYDWTMKAKPDGSVATLSDSQTVGSSFVPDLEGSYSIELLVSDFLGAGTSDDVTIMAASMENFVEMNVIEASDRISSLSHAAGEVAAKGHKQALIAFLSQAILAVQRDDMKKVTRSLKMALERMDGCAVRGMPDPEFGDGIDDPAPVRDWITDCGSQFNSYYPILDSLNAVSE